MHFSQFFRAAIVLCLSLSASLLQASDGYQFLASTSYTDISSADGERLGVEALAFWEPVKLDGATPFASADFYQRVSRISLSVSQQRLSELNQVRSGRVLSDADRETKALSLRLSRHDIPVWAELDYTNFDGTDEYTNGLSVDLDSDDAKRYLLGYFISDDTALRVSYLDADPKGWGVMLGHLFRMQNEMFLELGLEYQSLELDAPELEVVNNSVRNLVPPMTDINIVGANLSFSPIPALELSVSYMRKKVADDWQANRGLAVSYWFESYFSLSASYLDIDYGGNFREFGDSNFYIDAEKGVSLSLRF
mgnify:CR=1 FL=1